MVAICVSLSIFLMITASNSVIDYGGKTDLTNGSNSIVIFSPDNVQGNLPGNETEYWALIVAVGIYANNPDMDRPSMLVESAKLQEMLPVSSNWDENHMKVIERENATVPNIINGFRWLDEMEDENDISLVYLTTHGFPILFDIPPFDEEDGMDEALATYRGFLPFPNPWSWEPLANAFAILTDDEINFFLNRLESKGIGVIVDSCHSGGFNDNWSYSKAAVENWAKDFAGELQGRNRVIITSVPETETSYGSYFSNYIIKGLQGYGDVNGDGMCSLEEAFNYAKPIIEKDTGMRPQIFDDYPGELIFTEKEMPPSQPEKPEGPTIGKTNTTYSYETLSSDPEGDDIKYLVDWGDGSEEWTLPCHSGIVLSISHSWDEEGTYSIKVMASDEKGAESEWSEEMAVTLADRHIVDQRQVVYRSGSRVNITEWVAQSFVPSLDRISKIEINLFSYGESNTVTLMLRENLDGIDMATSSKTVEPAKDWEESKWISFGFNEVSLTPGKEYYIVCYSSAEEWSVRWSNSGRNNDVYQNGTIYYSEDAGITWESRNNRDATFVTYG